MSSISKNNCIKVSSLLFFLLFLQSVNAQYNFSELDKKLEASKGDLSKDMAALIYKDGKIIYKKEFGQDFKANSQEPIADCSKWLTAAVVMTFVDQGKLSLDDKVGTYLPIFNTYGKKYITIRQCLSHMTGIQSEQGVMKLMQKNKFATLEEEVNDFASKREIQSNPGLEFRYTNIGLDIAAHVCEVVGKRSIDQLLNDRILRPLAMRNTSFFSERAISPSSGATSAAIDYMNFLSMLLNNGVFNGKRILSEKAVAEMNTIQIKPEQIKYAPKSVTGYTYGLGEWIIDSTGPVVCNPSFIGTYSLIDYNKKYAFVLVTKSSGEAKKEVYIGLKNVIDGIIQ